MFSRKRVNWLGVLLVVAGQNIPQYLQARRGQQFRELFRRDQSTPEQARKIHEVEKLAQRELDAQSRKRAIHEDEERKSFEKKYENQKAQAITLQQKLAFDRAFLSKYIAHENIISDDRVVRRLINEVRLDLILTTIQENPKANLATLVKDLRTDVANTFCESKQIVVDRDGRVGYWVSFYSPFGPSSHTDILLYPDKDGILHQKEYLFHWSMDLVREKDLDGDGVNELIYFTYGGNGAGSGWACMFSSTPEGFDKVFKTPPLSVGGFEMKDMDGDGVEEMVCEECFEYKRAYFPRIYKWNGKSFVDATFAFPQYLLDYYKKHGDKKLDEWLQQKSEEHRKFFDAHIKPLGIPK